MEQKWRLVKKLQYLMTKSFYAKALDVKRVVSNKGKKTLGIDGELWETNKAKMEAAGDWTVKHTIKRKNIGQDACWLIYYDIITKGILNQAAADRELLRVLLNISDAQVNVVTSASKEQGLIYTGSNSVWHSIRCSRRTIVFTAA